MDLKSRRMELKLTLGDLSRISGIKIPNLSNLENAYRAPSENERRRIYRALGDIDFPIKSNRRNF